MNLHFTEDEQADFLLARGYIICVRVESKEINIYQNVFEDHSEVVLEAMKGSVVEPLNKAFEREFKTALIKI